MANIVYIKGVRTRFRNILATTIQAARDLLDAPLDEIDLDEHNESVQKCTEKIKTYSDKVEIQSERLANALGKDDDEQTEKIVSDDCEMCAEAMELYLDLKRCLRKIEVTQQKQDINTFEIKREASETRELLQLQKDMQTLLATQMKQQQVDAFKHESGVKLPKLEMISFGGDKTKWLEFWDSFKCAVHDNRHISNVDKFNYLKGKLFGEAKYAIQGLALSSENYQVAVEILRNRFGNVQEIVDMHYNQMINLTPASNRVSSLQFLLDKIEKHLRSLEVLGQNIDQDVSVSIIKSKIPEDVMLQLEIQMGSERKWSVVSLNEKLQEYVLARERAEKTNKVPNGKQNRPFQLVSNKVINKQVPAKNQFPERNIPRYSSAQALVSTGARQGQGTSLKRPESYFNKCRYCELEHWSDECTKFRNILDRKKRLQGSCYKCLKEGHSARDCKANKKCAHCGEVNSHHRSLCPKKFNIERSSVHLAEEQSQTPIELNDGIEQGQVLISSNEIVLMQTAQTEVANPSESVRTKTRLLLDSGSQRSYITEELANKLGLKPEADQELKLATFGSATTKIVKTKCVKLKLKLNNGSFMSISVNVVPTISGTMQRNSVVLSKQTEYLIQSVDLADTIPTKQEATTIELLIGNDYYLDIVLPNRIELEPGLYLLSTKMGWVLTGRTGERSESNSESSMLILTYGHDVTRNSCFTTVDAVLPLKPDLQDFWSIEAIGITDQHKNSNDESALKSFKESVTFEDGRYQVDWPWREKPFDLPRNHQLAIGRLKSTVKRLQNRPELMEKYNNIIEDQLRKGVIEIVDLNRHDGRVHYLPHHPVITPQKSTTKVRLVYDASAKPREDLNSLNECLFRGPVILQDLCGMLLRFRTHRYGIVADIEKAFLHIGLKTDQRDVTRFFWLKDTSALFNERENLQTYRFCRVPFGVISSPFLLGATIQHHLDQYDDDIAQKIKNNIYVDNVITGINTESESISFYNGAKEIFKDAAMNLRQWSTNSQMLNKYIPEEDRANENPLTVLGMNWDSIQDTIALKQISLCDKKTTKRSILKAVASNFDPMGLFSPVLLKGKILIQKLWDKGIDWDCNIPTELEHEWQDIRRDLMNLHDINIQRYVSGSGCENAKYDLIGFCDASERAYATAIYLKDSTNESKVNLLFSKSRLAPLKKISIPRLELLGILIGVRCMDFVEKQLNLKLNSKSLLSDSQCALQWLTTERDLPVFVRNRINEIKEHKDIRFGYVKSTENPADIATRGSTVKQLKCNKLWWKGPECLQKSGCDLPVVVKDQTDDFKFVTACNLVESYQCTSGEKKNVQFENPPFGLNCERYSSVTKLLRVTAYALKFVSCLKKAAGRSPSYGLNSTDLNKAEQMWIKYVQDKCFRDVICDIQTNKMNSLQRQLGLFLDNSGVLRCKGRLQNAQLTEGSRIPILLPRNERFTTLVIEQNHQRLLHNGVSQTLSYLRHKYWIPRGRASVKTVIGKCKICKRYEGGPYKLPIMPPFPKERVMESPAFSHVGLDYFGPLYIKGNLEKQKVWVILFTCLVTRAVHLEMVQDMSTEEFLLGLRRFIAQRNVPVEIISDNAKQFKSAKLTLDSLWSRIVKSEDVQNSVAEQRIKWIFIVQLAPWMGGLYERLVGIVKRSLRKTIGVRSLTFIQMQNVLKEVEKVVNTRPLHYVENDINSIMTLTPNHFLTLNPNVSLPDFEDETKDPTFRPIQSSSENLVKTWIKGQKLLTQFWHVWRDEYLQNLRERTQTHVKTGRVKATSFPNEGDVVTIKDELPRCCWRMGIITKTNMSRDGNIRSADIRIASGRILKRPLNLIYPLETTSEMYTDIHSGVHSDKNIVLQRPVREAAIKAKEAIKQHV